MYSHIAEDMSEMAGEKVPESPDSTTDTKDLLNNNDIIKSKFSKKWQCVEST